ncbi:T9SS type A sorting domain-containing protein [Gracilimonas sp.]|uniref:T9SS type A sorting domain-containing protein n=1 Tax=Gracilimonas sp. TaxID=1974203 RepID=UPI0032EAF380
MKMNKILTVLSFMLIPALAFAQNWTQDDTFVPEEGDTWVEVHGVAVDGEGKIWIQPFGATDSVTLNRTGVKVATRVIYIYNPDGTPASFSPLKVIEYEDDTPADTLGQVWQGEAYEGYSGRGIEADYNGDIIISQFNRVYKVDHTTGMGIAKVDPGIGSLGEASADKNGNIYVSAVVATDAPIIKYDSNLENPEELLTLTSGFSRDLQVSPDGNTIWWAGYTGPGVLRYARASEFESFPTVPDTVLRGIRAESFDLHPQTFHLWVGSGSLNDVPGEPYQPQTWYAFDYADLDPETTPTALDSIEWVAGADVSGGYDQARPRGLDFSPDGTIAYVGAFSATETAVDVQKFTTEQVYTSNENNGKSDIPEGYTLKQNYPNPFNPTTNIEYSINEAGPVTIKVYDMTGREVATLVNSRMSAGDHTVSFDASNLSSGVYIYMLQTNGVRLTNKMTLIK